MTVAPVYTGPRGPAPDAGLAAMAAVARFAYAQALADPALYDDAAGDDLEQVRRFSAYLAGAGTPGKRSAPPAGTSADARRTLRQREAIAAGRHPVTRLELRAEGGTCGDCTHRVTFDAHRPGRYYHKCDTVPVTNGAATDLRLHWPACTRYEPR